MSNMSDQTQSTSDYLNELILQGWSQDQVARFLAVSRPRVKHLADGTREPHQLEAILIEGLASMSISFKKFEYDVVQKEIELKRLEIISNAHRGKP